MEIINSIFSILKERLSSRYLGYLTISVIGYHWKLFFLLTSSVDYKTKICDIETYLNTLCWLSLVGLIFFPLILILVLDFFSYLSDLSTHFLYKWRKNLLHKRKKLIQELNIDLEKEETKLKEIKDRLHAVKGEKESSIHQLISGKQFNLHFHPPSKGEKKIEFLSNGIIGIGKDQNESRWEFTKDKLVIYNNKNEIYSRFYYDAKNRSFKNTNEKDTLSARDQYLEFLK